MRQREQAHALVVRHERAHDRARLPARQPRRRVVDRLVEAESPGEPVAGEPLQVAARLLGRDHQRERRRVRRDDEILGQPALQAQPGHAERAVLVVEAARRPRCSRDSEMPQGTPRCLPYSICRAHRRAAGLVEQRVLVASASRAAASGTRTSSRSTTAAPARPPAVVSRRPSANQFSCGSWPCAIATKLASRASEASRS